MTTGYVAALRNAQLDAITTFVGNGGKVQLYTASRPATGGTATTALVNVFTCGSPFAPAASGGVLSPTLPAASTGSAAGTAAWFRLFKTDGTTICIDGSVGTSAADMIVNTTTISIGVAVSITAWTITRGNP